MSADEGAVEALLCREELSVDVPFVVLEMLLPRLILRSANMLSSAPKSTRFVLTGNDFDLDILAPPSNDRPVSISERSITRKDGASGDVLGAFSRTSAADFRLLKATENLGMKTAGQTLPWCSL